MTLRVTCIKCEGGHYCVDHWVYVISPHSPPHSLQYSKNVKNDKIVLKSHQDKIERLYNMYVMTNRDMW